MSHQPLIVVLSGPSGSGKTTLRRRLAKKLGLHFSVSHTTRKLREGEKDGLDYHFVSLSDFQKMADHGELVESAEVYGNWYGTSIQEIERGASHGIIMDVDPQGALAIKKKYPKALLLFILPPTHQDLEARLAGRGAEGAEVRAKRLLKAKEEEQFKKYYSAVVTNRELPQALNELESLINKHMLSI